MKRQASLPASPRIARLEALPQPVLGHRRDLAEGESIAAHEHRRHQLIHASEGVMRVVTRRSTFLVPERLGVWMPGGVVHSVEARTRVSMRTLYLDPGQCPPRLPDTPCVVQVRPLLRELTLALVDARPVYAPASPEGHIARVVLDELARLPVTPLALPIPTSRRLAAVVDALMADPSDPRDLAAWARLANTSERTLSRLFHVETGMSLRSWRQQRRLLAAVEMLARGASVTRVAMELGYGSPSAFSAMFKRVLGTPPSRYFP